MYIRIAPTCKNTCLTTFALCLPYFCIFASENCSSHFFENASKWHATCYHNSPRLIPPSSDWKWTFAWKMCVCEDNKPRLHAFTCINEAARSWANDAGQLGKPIWEPCLRMAIGLLRNHLHGPSHLHSTSANSQHLLRTCHCGCKLKSHAGIAPHTKEKVFVQKLEHIYADVVRMRSPWKPLTWWSWYQSAAEPFQASWTKSKTEIYMFGCSHYHRLGLVSH